MKLLDNFLTSGHHFTIDENLQKFRFALLNIFIAIATLFDLIHFFASITGLLPNNLLFTLSLSVLSIFGLVALYALRIKKDFYFIVVLIFITSSAFLFYFVLFTHPEDEFRLVAFFLLLFTIFVLMGKVYGVGVAIIIFVSILFISKNYYLNLSVYAFATFYTFFIIFTVFLFFFLHKVEKDAIEFQILNTKLKEKVSKEVQQRQEQEQMLLQQCRMASMGEMIDSIAHQWRQPLMSINAILMNIDRSLELKTKPSSYLDNKMDEVIILTTHMSQTIEDFRSLFQTNKDKELFSLNISVNHALGLFKESLKEIQVTHNIPSELEFHGYKNEFIQVIIILLHNAIEVLEIRGVAEKQITISCHIQNQHLHTCIEDNAGGIAVAHLAKIFDPYFSTKKSTGGTGLGLYIAKIIIEHNMKGTLKASNTNKGAKLEIVLPNV